MNALRKSLLRIRALIKKEFLAMFRDKGTRMVLIVPVLVQAIIFGYGANFTPEQVRYAILDDARDATSAALVQQIAATPMFKTDLGCKDLACLRRAVSEGEAIIGIYFGSDFKDTHELLIIADSRNTTLANTVIGFVQAIAGEYNAQHFVNLISINPRYVFNENTITRYTIMTGMILGLSMIQVLMLSAFSVSREREEGSFDMMLMTPANPLEMLIGKAVPPVLIAIAQGLALFLICVFYFEIPFRGRFAHLFAIIAIFSACNVGIGLVISTVCKTSLQSVVSSFLFLLPCIMISGLITPADAMPRWFYYIAHLDPMYYANNCMWRIYLEGASLSELWHLIVPLLLIGAGTMALAASLFRNKLD